MKSNKNSLKVFILDFDGVIVESNHIKDTAFDAIFSKYPEHYECMMDYHRTHNAVDRHKKFVYFVEEVLGDTNNQELIEELAADFEKHTQKAIITCDFVRGAKECIAWAEQWLSLYVVSATPQQSLKDIMQARNLAHHFKGIYGSAIKKQDAIINILNIENATNVEALFVGDSPEDQQVAHAIGIQFIGRQSDRALAKKPDPILEDMKQVQEYIRSEYF